MPDVIASTCYGEVISRDCPAPLATTDSESVNKLFVGLLQNGKGTIMVSG
jgi:hypothetical protein